MTGPDVPAEAVLAGAAGLEGQGVPAEDFARLVFAAATEAGWVLVPGPISTERCRECRDEGAWLAPVSLADFILWGKLLPPEALGPRCTDHAMKWLPHLLEKPDQYAVFDLRPYRSAEFGRFDPTGPPEPTQDGDQT